MNIEQYKYSLHFKDVVLERKFRNEHAKFLPKAIWIGVPLAIILEIIGIVIIYFVLPEYFKAILLVLGIPALLIFPFFIYASYKTWYKSYNIVSVALLNFIIGAQLIFITFTLPGLEYPAFIGLIMAAFFSLYLYQIRHVSMVSITIPPLIFYQYFIITNEAIGTSDLALMSFWIWSIIVFAMIVSRLSENKERGSFIYRQIIKEEQQKSDRLLLNILPKSVADELKKTGKSTAKKYDNVTILFTDFIDFTSLVASIPAVKLVEELNDIFGQFDDIMAELEIEKIQTVGDAYLAACGLPKIVEDHAQKCVKAAKLMLDYLEIRNSRNKIQWKMRVGIHTGSIVAGVVGKKKFSYDLFGDTINTASRFETAGEPGKINISSSTYEHIKEIFPCEYRGKILAKGQGELDMYFVK